MPDKSPGQLAYEARCAVLQAHWLPASHATWNVLRPVEQRAWEAAAQAVRALAQEDTLTLDLDPDVQREDDPHAP